MKNIAIIGSTGSIGVQTLNVIRRNPDKFNVVSLAGGKNTELLARQAEEFSPKVVCSQNKTEERKGIEYYYGDKSFVNAVVEDADLVVVALSGFYGIYAVLECIKKGKNIALANKESLVVGGELVIKQAKEKGIDIIPIDSEHSAIFQALNFNKNTPFQKLIITCSGGAFRDYSLVELKSATAKKALSHPNWNMGKRITVDCATLINKGFEVIEAKWLYNTDFDKISAIIHRESIIHSLVEFRDNSVMAQLSYPTMEIPIAVALSYPERLTSSVKSLNFAEISNLSFENIDNERFPCFNLTVECGKKGGNYPAVLNGADEELVKLYLQNKTGYNDFYKGLSGALESFCDNGAVSIESLEYADRFGREYIKKHFGE